MSREHRIYVNGRALTRPLTGVERWATEVTRRLEGRARVIRPERRLSGARGHLWEQFLLPLHLKGGGVLWSPANSGPLAVSRQVVSLYDLSPLEHPEWFEPAFALLYRLLLPRLFARARSIAVPSQFTRRQLLHRFPKLDERVALVSGGVDLDVFYPRGREEVEAVRRAYGLPEEYLLCVGTLQPRKNLLALLEAWSLAAPALPEFTLVIAGGAAGPFRRQRLALPPRVRLLGYVPDERLPALYSGAAAFILPAFDEGFGLPLLEAMACGVPAAAAESGALPELAEGAAMLFDPSSPQRISGCILMLLSTHPRAERACIAREKAALYPWERTASAMLGLLEAV